MLYHAGTGWGSGDPVTTDGTVRCPWLEFGSCLLLCGLGQFIFLPWVTLAPL